MYSIPNGVTDIGRGSFHSCDGLTSIIVPPSVTNISVGIGAAHGFSSCKNLQTAYVPISPLFDVASLKIPESTELIYYNPDIGPQPSYTASSFNGTFNGNYRGITVSVSQPTSGYTIQYATSSSGPWSSTKPTYRNVCSGVKTYFKIMASGYADVVDYRTVTITAKTLTSSMVSLSATSFVYDGAAKEPSVSFTDANVTSSDYTISYANNVNPGTATVTITGKSNYTGTVTKTFTIEEVAVTHPDVTVDGIHWTGSGEAAWTIDSTSPFAATSGDVDDGQSTSLIATFSGQGTLSFKWKVSSEANFDFLSLYTNGVLCCQISGTDNDDYETQTVIFPSDETHTLTWVYSKDGSQSSGQDCGWIRDVTWAVGEFPEPSIAWEYTVDNGEVTITGVSQDAVGAVEIPGMIEGYPVTKIGSYAFFLWDDIESSLESIVIPHGVTEIGPCAFLRCGNLKRVMIPSSVTTIGGGAFRGCNLEELQVDEGNLHYSSQDGVLFDKQRTTLIQCGTGVGADYVIPNDVTTIADGAFILTEIEDIRIPDNVTNLGESAFGSCYSLTNVVIGRGVNSIPNGAFSSCENLETVSFGPNVTNIGGAAFAYTGLRSVIIPDAVLSLGVESEGEGNAFAGCCNLTNVVIGGGVTSIPAGTFSCCCALPEIEIPKNVMSIGREAFSSCGSLAAIRIPDSVTFIGGRAFMDCLELRDIVIGDGVKSLLSYYYDEYGDVAAYDEIFDFSSVTNLVIGDGVTQIDEYLLSGCENLKNVVIGASVTNIATGAFDCCSRLTEIYIPDCVTSVGELVFSECWALKTVSIPAHLAEYTEVLQEGNAATIQIRDEFELVVTDFLYEETDEGIVITGYDGDVPGELVIPSEIGGVAVVGIGESAFEDGLSLVSVTIPDSVTTIGAKAFCWCENLERVTMGNGVTSLGNYVFRACGLTTIDIPDSVTTVGIKVFQGCDNLTTITVPADFSEANCTSLQEGNDATIVRRAGVDPNIVFETTADGLVVAGYNGTVPDSLVIPARKDGVAVVGIKASAFEDCDTLVSVTIPDSVTTIGDGAFYWCVSLEQVSLGTGLTTIGNNAFRACEALKTVTIPASVTSIGTRVFQGCDALTDIYITEQQSGFVDALKYGNSAVVHIGSGTSTTGGVPHAWIDDYKGDPAFATAVAAAGGDYEKLAQIKGLNGYTFEECYVIGIKPTEENRKFSAKIEIVDGVPMITPDPNLGTDRRYVTEGVSELGGRWTEIKSDADKAGKRFFRVKVALPK